MSELKLAYYAGLFDGEGCIRLANLYRPGASRRPSGFAIRVDICMTDTAVLYDLARDFGGQVYCGIPRKKATHKQLYQWVVCSVTAKKFLVAIRPFLRIKYPQVDVALQFQSRVETQKRRNQYTLMPDEEYAIRLQFKQQLQQMKKLVIAGVPYAMGANSGNGATPNPELTRRQSLKCVETIDPRQSLNGERHEIVQSIGN